MITVYVLQGRNRRYIGVTNDLRRRLNEHRRSAGKVSLLGKDFIVLHSETCRDYGSARKREKFLKSGQGRKLLAKLYPLGSPAKGG